MHHDETDAFAFAAFDPSSAAATAAAASCSKEASLFFWLLQRQRQTYLHVLTDDREARIRVGSIGNGRTSTF